MSESEVKQRLMAWSLPGIRERLSLEQQQWMDYMTKYHDYLPVMYNKERGLSYVWTRKVASTSWSVLFYELAGRPNVGVRYSTDWA